jgi:LysE type translocator
LLGLSTSFLGSLPLGIISVLVMDIAAKRTWQSALLAAVGVSAVEYLQAFFAVACTSMFVDYPFLKTVFSILGLPIFLILAYQHLNHSGEVGKKQIGEGFSPFVQGAFVSSLNMAAIPYWILWGGLFLSKGWVVNDWQSLNLFAAGSALGTFLAMVLYIFVGLLFKNALQKYNLFVNRTIGTLFLLLAMLQLWGLLQISGLVG